MSYVFRVHPTPCKPHKSHRVENRHENHISLLLFIPVHFCSIWCDFFCRSSMVLGGKGALSPAWTVITWGFAMLRPIQKFLPLFLSYFAQLQFCQMWINNIEGVWLLQLTRIWADICNKCFLFSASWRQCLSRWRRRRQRRSRPRQFSTWIS